MSDDELRQRLYEALLMLGVTRAATWDDGCRWSRGDLATDLTPLVRKIILEAEKELTDG